ncbi:cyanophycinase [Thermocoleostomius sinensis]|uniref:Cyanophycinase n=1 Tax=Thermocoleostomius sinensis A174 TaxID=2016057 RepID=A0A9E9C2T4_9CYAN|nr:cyanophycinase [Thermocoleostomius sinensis]WAL58216.1 cyanophycinase [Thermocoleostomius sinensis A174]
MPLNQPQGQLVIIGGAEDTVGDCQILREFVRRSGGTKARIIILTAASSLPDEVGEEYIEIFKRLGVEEVGVIDTRHADDANHPNAVKQVAQATGIFFTGGDQARIIRSIKGTILEDVLHKRYADGAVIAGTSAGAAVMPEQMIVEGESDTNPRLDAVEMGPGMGFLSRVVVDQHFAQRGRLGRLLSAILLEPSVLGLGIDENTAVIVSGNEFEVIGEGAVTIVDESEKTYNNVDHVLKDEPVAVFGIKLHILPQGCRYNFITHQPIAPQ